MAPLALALLVAIANPIAADSSGPTGFPAPLPLPVNADDNADSIPAPPSSFAPVDPPLAGFS